jgi:uncharacterized protein YdbL (DUF1318 family)
MKTLTKSLSLFLTLGVFSCVTINIYFPAEQMRGAADKIVEEVWGEQNPPAEQNLTPTKPGSRLFELLLPAAAYAAQDINLSTPEIRAIKDSIKQRAAALIGFLKAGNLGLGHDGLLVLRGTDGLNLKQRGEVNRLLKEENADRLRLYKEIAVANGFPDKVAEVQSIFAESWQSQASKGWFVETAPGKWMQR